MPSAGIVPAPWTLSGSGVVLLYHFPHAFNSRWGFMQPYQHKGYRGWLGAVMLVDYTASDAGPYQELLFIPGLFRLGGRLAFSISKIWVSTQASVQSGRHNWGIPKELAQFRLERSGKGITHFQVATRSAPFFSARLRPGGPPIPFRSSLLPGIRIMQQKEEALLLTAISASGRMRLSSLQEVYSQPDFFPPIDRLRPIASLSINDFLMHFPQAELVHQRSVHAADR